MKLSDDDDAVDSLKPGDLNKMFEKSLEFDGTTLRDSFNDTVGVDAATDPNADEDSDVNVDVDVDKDEDRDFKSGGIAVDERVDDEVDYVANVMGGSYESICVS